MKDKSIPVKVGFILVNVVIVVAGWVSLTAFYSFERFGGDPQKRGLINQVSSRTGKAQDFFRMKLDISDSVTIGCIGTGSIHSPDHCHCDLSTAGLR